MSNEELSNEELNSSFESCIKLQLPRLAFLKEKLHLALRSVFPLLRKLFAFNTIPGYFSTSFLLLNTPATEDVGRRLEMKERHSDTYLNPIWCSLPQTASTVGRRPCRKPKQPLLFLTVPKATNPSGLHTHTQAHTLSPASCPPPKTPSKLKSSGVLPACEGGWFFEHS